MMCPICANSTRVEYSTVVAAMHEVRRRRCCKHCGKSFRTVEKLDGEGTRAEAALADVTDLLSKFAQQLAAVKGKVTRRQAGDDQ